MIIFEKINFIESQCINPQDAVIIRLLMEGIGTHEIVYLKKDSLDAANRLLVVKDSYGLKRQVPVTKRCVELFQNALQQTKYILNNGYNPNKQLSVNLRDSDFLIKVSMQDFIANQSMITDMDSVVLRTIYMRLRRLAEFFSTPELTHLTAVKLEHKERAYA
ncbi:phage lytic cycle repressor MrpR family protein [Paenibacillus sp. UNC451MF]|uniref:phage lytic cycle repressor MrpR family protein n=1 Tax=Paenibacillus sp. UNC451MF TaxID=1449063 RepID=UPI003FA7EAFA